EEGVARVQFERLHAAEVLARPQVHDGGERPAVGERDVLLPRLGVDAAGHAHPGVVRDVALHDLERREAERLQLGALEALLEPAASVVVDDEVDVQQAGDRRLLHAQLAHADVSSWRVRTHSRVARSPSVRLVGAARPSSARARETSRQLRSTSPGRAGRNSGVNSSTPAAAATASARVSTSTSVPVPTLKMSCCRPVATAAARLAATMSPTKT